MPRVPKSPWLVPFDGSFRIRRTKTKPPKKSPSKKEARRLLASAVERIAELQRALYAENRQALLLIFHAMDAAGKDSTIRAVTQGVDAAGFQVFSFKHPSTEELDHDFLWRTSVRLPERGRIGIFNRSYYEDVLIVRVHPEILEALPLPGGTDQRNLWKHRFESIREHERHLARSGTVIVKFFLNVSREEQRKRFLSRIEEPAKNWKFSMGDVRERAFWDEYMNAYEFALAETSRPWAPWYAVPADDKPFLRLVVAETVAAMLEAMNPRYPKPSDEHRHELAEARRLLEAEDDRPVTRRRARPVETAVRGRSQRPRPRSRR